VPATPTSIEGRDARALILEKREPSLPDAVPGDLVLQGHELSAEVAGQGPPERLGTLVTLRQSGTRHPWQSLVPFLWFDAELHRIELAEHAVKLVGEDPAIVLRGSVQAGDARLEVERTLRLADVNGVLRITTRVWASEGSLPVELGVVERVRWGGGAPEAPLQPALVDGPPVDAEWIGRALEREALVVGALDGNLRIQGEALEHGRADKLDFTDLWLPARLEGDARLRADALLCASLQGLGDAVRRLGWARGRPFEEAVVMLDSDPPGAEVRAVDAENGNLVAAGTPDNTRRVVLPLPSGAAGRPLAVVALAHGHEASARLPLLGAPRAPVLLKIPEGGVVEVSAVQAATLEPIPVRVRVLPREGSASPNLGPDWAANGAIDTVIASAGHARIALPSGFYRMIVAHGPEWTVYDEPLELDVGATVRVQARLEHVVDPGPFVACEFHVHAEPSHDSQVPLEGRVASLVAEGIALAVATDHNHVTDYGPAIQAQPLQGLASLTGVEVTTGAPYLGHFNVFPYPLDPDRVGNGAPEYLGQRPATLFQKLHAVSPELVVQVNHPRWTGGIGYFELFHYDATTGTGDADYSDDFDALEVWNGFDIARREVVDSLFQEWLAMLARGRHVVATGSSDSHTIRSQAAGYPRTYVRAPAAFAQSPRAIVRSLKQGRAFVTSGPFLDVQVDGHGPGEQAPLAGETVFVTVSAQTAPWMRLSSLRAYLGKDLVYRSPLEPLPATGGHGPHALRYEHRLQLLVPRDAPLVVAVDGDQPYDAFVAKPGVRPFAFTNPIWLTRASATAPAP
jgi:hypothetical protein